MIEPFSYLFGAIALIGAAGTMLQKDPFDKLISLGVLAGLRRPGLRVGSELPEVTLVVSAYNEANV
ncbi:MAG: hypothetical protein RQ758_02650, partial [Methanomicrobiaceae archaeon]|nr:hypothetical protein [Methanomicrobiaceae archaeon]